MANAYQPTYSSLLLEIPDICEDNNAQFLGNIPNFLNRAQDQVMRDLSLEQWRGYYLDTLGAPTSGQGSALSYLRQPSWLMVRGVFLPPGGGTGGVPAYGQVFLQKRNVDWIRTHNNPVYGTPPKYWSDDYINPTDQTNSYLLIAPIWVPPQGSMLIQPTFPARFDVVQRFLPLTQTNQSNWITNNCGDLLLYLALKQAHIYLINPESAQTMEAIYQATLQSAQQELLGMERAGYPLVRVAPQPSPRGGIGP